MRHSGTTLMELLVVMAVLAMLMGFTLPSAARWRDGAAVRAARDELASGLAWTRTAAAAHGGATLVLDTDTGRFWTFGGDGTPSRPVDLRDRYRVQLDAGSSPALFRYDALGIGRLTSRTIRVRRGGAEAGLTVSAYGRVRRW